MEGSISRSRSRSRPIAAFMAFGTKGDVYPIAALAASFATHHHHFYDVFFITHSAHQHLSPHLSQLHVSFTPLSSPPTLPPPTTQDDDDDDSFRIHKTLLQTQHRRECLSVMDTIFGNAPPINADFVLINFFALEGWSLAELFHIRCVVAAPYVVPYAPPSSFEPHFRRQLPHLYNYLQQAPPGKLGWKDVTHWMWPLFSQDWGVWRKDDLKLSPLPFTDPVTALPMWHHRPQAPLLLYGFSKQIVESPNYWPSNSRVSGFWFLPPTWQLSCNSCRESLQSEQIICSLHAHLHNFLHSNTPHPLVFVGLSSAGHLGFLRNPMALLRVIQAAIEITNCSFILLTSGFDQLNAAVQLIATQQDDDSPIPGSVDNGVALFGGRLFCFPDSIPYSWLFQKCAVAVHHGGSGSTAAALKAGVPQIICPLMADQFYWAERMSWLGVAPQPLKRNHLVPDNSDDITIKEGAYMLSLAINFCSRPEVKEHALKISEKISEEDGVLEAVRLLKEEIS